MKTNLKKRNNVQKTTLNVAAIIISLIILSVTVNAQGIWKSFLEMNDMNKNDMVLANDTKNYSDIDNAGITETNSFSAYSELEKEKTLDLEDWMIDESYFADINVNPETEEALQLDDWMTNENYFNPVTFQVDVETESPLELEDWMLNENYFQSVKNEEQPMALKNWMISENFWK